ncbi:MAG: 1-acyl-sn-glycerol-3-phosphate acyltransferase [Oscillospiraceae bacterium]|nr:1-acyl-sn-glycerol-3-phosphate acyltransferase [Oscillospiraceae bacterium]
MKIKTKTMTYDKVMALPRPAHKKPYKPSVLLQTVVRIASIFDLLPTKFKYTEKGMEKIGKNEPCLILMNHSSFIDLKIASGIFYPRRYGIVSTFDTLMGKELLMRLVGCFPTQKFVTDITLIKDMQYLLQEKKVSVLMYPEAGYSFDGCTTTLPRKMGVLLKKLGVPVVTVITKGAFARDPLYNGLQLRKVPVSAEVTCIATAEELKSKSVAELDALIDEAFSFDNFRWQQENGIKITEPFRADGLHRILYKCPHCGAEDSAEGKGISWTCHHCGKQYTLTETGFLEATDGHSKFTHIPDWMSWQREQVRKELERGEYSLDVPVKIGMMVDFKALYMVGEGRLVQDGEGIHLTGCDGKLEYHRSPVASHSLNADFFWYEIGDVICVGDSQTQYYCFPQDAGNVVTKARLAAEELYKLKKRRPAEG